MNIIQKNKNTQKHASHEDPMSGVANLFDVSVVLIVAMLFALISAFNMTDMLDPESEVTYTKRNSQGEIEIISKKGKEIKVQKVTETKNAGNGVRLGTAFQLENGKIIYVPED